MRKVCGCGSARAVALALFLFCAAKASPEDMELRNHAVQLMDRVQLASRFQGPLNIVTDVSFTASVNGDAPQAGTYKRTRSANGDLREDVAFPGFHSSFIDSEAAVAYNGPWSDKPYAVRKLKSFVPYSPLHFDATDVIESMAESTSGGQPAICIGFVTVRGEDRNPGEICIAKANSTVIEWHDARRSWAASAYTNVAGAMVPSAFTYREGNTLLLQAEVSFTLLDGPPAQEIVVPAGWNPAEFCSTYQPPAPIFAPQPAAQAPDSPVVHVHVHAHVRLDGKLEAAEVLKPTEPELDAEALKLVSTWIYKPSMCNGNPSSTAVDLVVNFQRR